MAICENNNQAVTIQHGGSLARAERLFPDAPKPWLDLSTGINPHSYPFKPLPASVFARLPEEEQLQALRRAAAKAYDAPDAANIAAAPGTQILLPMVASLVPKGRAAILSPTYAEHARAAALCGHEVAEVEDLNALYEADLAILVNPNNPDGRVIARTELERLAAHLRAKGGLLIMDEAFMDAGPRDESMAGSVTAGGIIVLCSFGKFFGLAGTRLGFAIATEMQASRLTAWLGPWAVSGPALEIGLEALSDLAWQSEMREKLLRQAARLDALLAEYGIEVAGGTPLFRYLHFDRSDTLFRALGQKGIFARTFAHDARALRIGLPGSDADFVRLAYALQYWRSAGRNS